MKASFDLSNLLRSPLDPQVAAASPARIAVEEMQALSLDAEVIAPEHSELAEHLVAQFRAPPMTGDHLRVPPPRNLTGQQISRSVVRMLAHEPAGASSPEAAIAEAKMRRVLEALDATQRAIRQNVSAKA